MLPDGLAPEELAAPGGEVEGTIELASMPRLAPLLERLEGAAHLRLHGGVDEAGRRYLAGAVRADLPLLCQRCLQPFAYRVEVDVHLVLVASEQEGEALPEELEPLVSTGAVAPAEIAEEELLLALPLVARHPDGECGTPPNSAAATRAELSPFAALKGRVGTGAAEH